MGYTEVSFTKVRKDSARIKTYPCNESTIVLKGAQVSTCSI